MDRRSLISNQRCISFLGLSLTMLAVGKWIFTCANNSGLCLPDFWTTISLLVAVISLDISRRKPALSHTFVSLLIQYACQKLFPIIGKISMKNYVKHSKKCKATQEQLLRNILKRNIGTLVGKSFGLDNIHSVEDFRQCIPLTTYSDYLEYIEMVNESGIGNVFFPEKANYVALTSGTTSGKSKAFPKSSETRKRIMKNLMLFQHVSSQFDTGLLKKYIIFRVCAKLSKCKSGLDCGPISAILPNSLPFLTVSVRKLYGEFEALYIQLIFALREEDIAYFSTPVATTALTVFNILEKHWEALCGDIEVGRIPEWLDIPGDERERFNKDLRPCPERANFLRQEFSKGFDNIVPRIWPTCPFLHSVKTGVFESAGNAVKEKYLGNVPCVTPMHIGSETLYGVNIHPFRTTVSFAPLITLNFFEFIPEDEMESIIPQTMLAHQVEVGKTYELVITTFEGLYRYRTEDVVQITDFFHSTPLYSFVRRAGDILSVGMDKVPEFLLRDAVKEAAKLWKNEIVEFTSCESVHVNRILGCDEDAKHYYVLIETENTNALAEKLEQMVDEGLCRRHDVYAAMRRNKKLQPIRFIQLKPGTYDVLKQKMMEFNPSAFCMQVKIPRILRRENLLRSVLAQKIRR